MRASRPPRRLLPAVALTLVLVVLGLSLGLGLHPPALAGAIKVDQFRSPENSRWRSPAQLQPTAMDPAMEPASQQQQQQQQQEQHFGISATATETALHPSLLQHLDHQQLVETQGLGNLMNVAKSAVKGAAKAVLDSVAGQPGTGSGIPILPVPTPAPPAPLGAEDIENCVACRYIWLQVEMDVFNSQSEEQIYEAFTRRCTRAMLTSIFFSPCQHMQFYARKMVSEYMRGYTVNQICANSLLCL